MAYVMAYACTGLSKEGHIASLGQEGTTKTAERLLLGRKLLVSQLVTNSHIYSRHVSSWGKNVEHHSKMFCIFARSSKFVKGKDSSHVSLSTNSWTNEMPPTQTAATEAQNDAKGFSNQSGSSPFKHPSDKRCKPAENIWCIAHTKICPNGKPSLKMKKGKTKKSGKHRSTWPESCATLCGLRMFAYFVSTCSRFVGAEPSILGIRAFTHLQSSPEIAWPQNQLNVPPAHLCRTGNKHDTLLNLSGMHAFGNQEVYRSWRRKAANNWEAQQHLNSRCWASNFFWSSQPIRTLKGNVARRKAWLFARKLSSKSQVVHRRHDIFRMKSNIVSYVLQRVCPRGCPIFQGDHETIPSLSFHQFPPICSALIRTRGFQSICL